MDPLIGREDILERTIQVLCRRFKNNPVHVGEPGVGKTAITEGSLSSSPPGRFRSCSKGQGSFHWTWGRSWPEPVSAATSRSGLNGSSSSSKTAERDPFHRRNPQCRRRGAVSGGSMDAGNILKPALVSGKLRCIGSTTYDEYRSISKKMAPSPGVFRRSRSPSLPSRTRSKSSAGFESDMKRTIKSAIRKKDSGRPPSFPTGMSATAVSLTRRSTLSTKPVPLFP